VGIQDKVELLVIQAQAVILETAGLLDIQDLANLDLAVTVELVVIRVSPVLVAIVVILEFRDILVIQALQDIQAGAGLVVTLDRVDLLATRVGLEFLDIQAKVVLQVILAILAPAVTRVLVSLELVGIQDKVERQATRVKVEPQDILELQVIQALVNLELLVILGKAELQDTRVIVEFQDIQANLELVVTRVNLGLVDIQVIVEYQAILEFRALAVIQGFRAIVELAAILV
jgi:hypothetical protein